MKIKNFYFLISIFLASSYFLIASSQRINLNNTITSINIINSNNILEKTVFSENGKFVFFISGRKIYYNDIDSVLSLAPSTSLSTIGFQYSSTNNLKLITSVPFIGNDSKVIAITNNYAYLIDITQKTSREIAIGLPTNNDFNCYITNFLNNIFITASNIFYTKFDLKFIDENFSSDSSGIEVTLPQTMLTIDSKNKLIFLGNKGMIRLLDAKTLASTLPKSPLYTINDSVSRYVGSIDSDNRLLYTCSRNETNNPTMKLSFEILNYTSNSITKFKTVDINFIPKSTGSYFSKCNFSSIDLVQGQIFFTLIDPLLNQYILSMDINGNNQELFELNNIGNITALTIRRSSNNDNGGGGGGGSSSNKLLIGTSLGNPLLILNYKSICKNDCSGFNNGECINLKCICKDDFGLDDCSQRYPIISNVSGLPLKRPGVITIDGNYFGNDINKVSVKIGNSSFSCINIELINQQQIKCRYSENLIDYSNIQKSLDGYYKVFISIGDLSIESFKFNYLNAHYENSIQQDFDKIQITGENIMDLQYQSLFKLGNSNINKLNCNGSVYEIICSLPSDSVNGDLIISDIYGNSKIWSNLILKPQLISLSPLLISTSPTDLTINGLFFTSVIGTKIGDNFQILIAHQTLTNTIIKSSSTLEFKSTDRILTSKNSIISLLGDSDYKNNLTFGYLSPIITGFIQPSDSNNGLLRIQGSNFVNPLDKNYLQILSTASSSSNLISNIMDLNLNYIDIKLPNDFISSLITISIDGGLSNKTNSDGTGGNGLKYLNLKPIITNVSPLPSLKGDNITITGSYLSNDIYMIISNNNNNNNNNIKLNCEQFINGNKIICKVPIGSGKFKIISQSINPYDSNDIILKSKEFETSYALPIITSVSPNGFFSSISPNGFTITIQGNNFITDKLSTKVSISESNIDCSILDSITDTMLKCNFISNQNRWSTKISVNLTQNSLTTIFSDGFYHYTHCPGSPYECSNNGQCNYMTGLCDCKPGYQTKSDCSVSTTTVTSTTSTTSTTTSTTSTTTSTTTTTSSSQTGSSTSSNPNSTTTSITSSGTSKPTTSFNTASTTTTTSTSTPVSGSGNPSTLSSSSSPSPTSSSSPSPSGSEAGVDSDNILSSSNIFKTNHYLISFALIFTSLFF
ncbi:hypothetical protein RB653_003127 [Dictyostelium firmibasis]|uniref:EGF-like domain-containing protein n=1 Tax=Dictyostelium firmibasis TaxID=79012 RepID=A0AAN7TRS1_9MYCE